MKIILIVWTLCSPTPEYQEFKKTVLKEILHEEGTTNQCLNKRLMAAHKEKKPKDIVYLVALYHEWNCELPAIAAAQLPSSLEASNVDELVKLVKEKLE